MFKQRIFLVLWVTNRCNLNCLYCYADTEYKKQNMTFETARKILDYFHEHPITIQFSGGEPLLNFSLVERICVYAMSNNVDVKFQIQTNATLLDIDTAQNIKELNISVGVSLDGPIEVNEVLRGSTKKTIQGLRSLASVGIMTNINCVVSNFNIDMLPKLIDFAIYLGNIRGIGFDLLRYSGRAKTDSQLILSKITEKQIIDLIFRMYNHSETCFRNTGKRIGLKPIEEAKVRLKKQACCDDYCYANQGNSYVFMPNGDCYPCPSLSGNEQYYLGNIHFGTLQYIAVQPNKDNTCKECEHDQYCSGACPARMILNGQDKVLHSLDCAMKKVSFEIAKSILNK